MPAPNNITFSRLGNTDLGLQHPYFPERIIFVYFLLSYVQVVTQVLVLQAPYCPPKPRVPEVHVASSSYEDSLQWLLHSQAHADVILVAGARGFSAHRFLLAAASPALTRLLCTDLTSELSTRSASESSMVSLKHTTG